MMNKKQSNKEHFLFFKKPASGNKESLINSS
ncbi:hypothetical protein H312_00954, partial [Anncaliia algerae PRA339]